MRRKKVTLTIESQSPRFGSRCFVRMVCTPLHALRYKASQSPRFGSRCFVMLLVPYGDRQLVFRIRRNPLGSGLGVSSVHGFRPRGLRGHLLHLSQSPRFGSRCFVTISSHCWRT